MPLRFWSFRQLLVLLLALFSTPVVNAQPATNTVNSELPRFLVYFDEFSANLSDEAKSVISDAVK